MRLTNTQRDAFVRAVMQDVPNVDYREQLETCIQDYMYQLAPKEVRVVYDNLELRKYLPVGSVHIYREDVGFTNMYLAPKNPDSWNRYDYRIELSKAQDAPALGVIKALIADMKAQETTRANLENKLRQTIYSVATLKAALELLPEFAKYLPEEPEKTAKNMLPAVANLVSDLNKAGWPKTEAK